VGSSPWSARSWSRPSLHESAPRAGRPSRALTEARHRNGAALLHHIRKVSQAAIDHRAPEPPPSTWARHHSRNRPAFLIATTFVEPKFHEETRHGRLTDPAPFNSSMT